MGGLSPERTCLLGPLPRPMAGLLFGLDNVLHDATVWRRWLLHLLGRLGVHTHYHSFYGVWDRDFLQDVHRGRRDFCEAFQTFLLSVGLSPAQIDEVEAACKAQRRQLENGARPLPGVKATLIRLHAAGLVLGVLSNSEHRADALLQKLDRFGLGGLFSTVISSVDLERTTPDPVCYCAAMRAMRLPVDRVAYVGHDPEELAGAAAVGMQTIAFNFNPDTRANVCLSRFEDLLGLTGASLPYAAAG